MSAPDDRWLYYGAVATPIDRAERTFGYVDDAEHPRFGTFPTAFLGRSDVSVDEERGRISLSALDRDLYRRFGNGFDRLDVGVLAADLVEETLFTPREARIVVLYGWFDMDRDTAADALETDPDGVASLAAAVRSRRERADRTATVRFVPE
ncbi:hypothetical protein [Halorubrum sp. Boch-26]|uniref:hypothetical protein n=1 Tax=Halorubrum sp. Boch-26 TaxID=2994426 RepID=UPI002468E93F|nr:hypothetical protein [Halorubrum sp. Boch-26]